MPRRIPIESWHPLGIEDIEPSALHVVRSTRNTAVVAGPGSGKTELLAQRAAFLLQTGSAPSPSQILAISFKRDAAKNLAARVRLRCHPADAVRFHSLTFDAFAKGLVDRFGQILPHRWRPTPDYDISFPRPRDYDNFLAHLEAPPTLLGTTADIVALCSRDFERGYVIGKPLAPVRETEASAAEWAGQRYWESQLHGGARSHLSFPMIGRLAELILRLNPSIRDGLRLTYSHVFMDEFQDTTRVQYDLLRTGFLGSKTVITAVGDTKQQIMRWAHAMASPFSELEADFNAHPVSLVRNYRSSPKLVRIQNFLARELYTQATRAQSRVLGEIEGDVCAVWRFSDTQVEASFLARFIAESINNSALEPRDFGLLVRQKATDYAHQIGPAFANRGLVLRNESALIGALPLQDLLTEAMSRILTLLLWVATSRRAPAHWGECVRTLARLHGIDSDDELRQQRLVDSIDDFGREFRLNYPDPVSDQKEAGHVVTSVQDFLGRERLIASNPAYFQHDWFDEVTRAITIHLRDSGSNSDSWTQTLESYEGQNAVPLMTIHKSKGLEYHTVLFVGLDDQSWWNYLANSAEEQANFFVAFSRAMQRVVFTYCKSAGQVERIARLYDLLEAAGVPFLDVG